MLEAIALCGGAVGVVATIFAIGAWFTDPPTVGRRKRGRRE